MKFCILMVLGLGLGCGGDKGESIKATAGGQGGEYCQVSETIIASRKDTPETLAQIRTANAIRRKLCKNPG